MPVNAEIWLAVGPIPAKFRPCLPRVSHAISEPGPPDRSAVVGWTAVSLVVVSRTAKIRSVSARIPSTRTPLTRPTVSSAASTHPNARAARRPIHRLSRPDTQRKKWAIPRAAATSPTKMSAPTIGSNSFEPKGSASAPTSSRIWLCHRCPSR